MAPSTASPERLARLRAICLAYPEASEKIAWGDPTWRVKDRIFAMQKGNYGGGRPSLWLKAAEGAQETLVAARPDSFFVPPYVGSKGWIGIYLDGARLEWVVIQDLILESYRLVAGPRLAARLAGDASPRATAGRAPPQSPATTKSSARGAEKQAPKKRVAVNAPKRAQRKRPADSKSGA